MANAPTPVLPSPEHSRAVLIGTATYDYLAPLPQVAAGLAGIRDALIDPQLCGLPEEHCTVLLDPGSPTAVLEALNHAASQATDALIVYLAGHGLLMGKASELHLALKGSDKEHAFRAVRYDDVRH